MLDLRYRLAEYIRRSLRPKPPATFCIHVWNHLRIEANSEGRVCSAYEEGNIYQDGVPMSVDRHALSEIWNSDMMRGLRRDMAAGQHVPGCRQCYANEARGGLSKRLIDLARWESGWLNESGVTIRRMIELGRNNDFRLPMLPAKVEVEIGNLCNFKCRTCNAGLSSLIGKDPVHRAWAANQFGAPQNGRDVSAETYAYRRMESLEKLGKEIAADTSGQIKRLYFLGGEPLLVREIGVLLEDLVAAGRARQLRLLFVSNASVIPRWLSLAPHFRAVDVTVSIDGYGDLHDYIRYPGRWPSLLANLQRLQQVPNVKIMANATISLLNALSICRLFRFLDSIGMSFAAYLLHYPRYLMVGALPSSVRRVAAARLRAYAGDDCRPNNRALVLSLAAQFESSDEPTESTLLRDFMLFTNDLDASREQSIRRAEPELVEMLAKSGYPWLDGTLLAC
jgi:MoaA/NifB/PqqE/SkfB family radical SAM enzyme